MTSGILTFLEILFQSEIGSISLDIKNTPGEVNGYGFEAEESQGATSNSVI
ncbi:hypothetical protein Patl1_07229 [Pistacia atlantica]|uniref:Uncharacterized protein n=1 Tax=Pistacia atlantica TaxID=434234 RepID=A0ACC1AGS1_9ROSI|nr:hypothetical protein Patl1_07229 [Pistacia atlantica]